MFCYFYKIGEVANNGATGLWRAASYKTVEVCGLAWYIQTDRLVQCRANNPRKTFGTVHQANDSRCSESKLNYGKKMNGNRPMFFMILMTHTSIFCSIKYPAMHREDYLSGYPRLALRRE